MRATVLNLLQHGVGSVGPRPTSDVKYTSDSRTEPACIEPALLQHSRCDVFLLQVPLEDLDEELAQIGGLRLGPRLRRLRVVNPELGGGVRLHGTSRGILRRLRQLETERTEQLMKIDEPSVSRFEPAGIAAILRLDGFCAIEDINFQGLASRFGRAVQGLAPGHVADLIAFAVTPDGLFLVSAHHSFGKDDFSIWDMETGMEIRRYGSDEGSVSALAPLSI
jgi:hypothetical protein